MDSNNMYEQEIDLKDLMFAVLHKWKGILLLAVIFAVLLGGMKGLSAYKTQTDAGHIKEVQETYENDLKFYESSKDSYDREIENLVDNITKQEEYLENSILMNISPYDVCEAGADLFIKTDYQIMPGMVYQNADYTDTILQAYQSLLCSNSVLDDVAEKVGVDIQYLQELITVQRGNMVLDGTDFGKFTNLITVKVRHSEKKKAQEILDALLEKVEMIQGQINNSIGEHTVTVVNDGMSFFVDLKLSEQQQTEKDRLTTLRNSLDTKEKEAKELKEPTAPASSVMAVAKSGVKYGVLGGVLGGFMSVFFVCVAFLMSDKVYAAKEIRSKFRIKVLGVLTAGDKKKAGAIDAWLNRLEGRGSGVEATREYELIAANIENLAGDITTILVTGTVEADKINRVCDGLAENLKNIRIIVGDNLLRSAETLKKLPECEGVVLVEQSGKSVCGTIGQEIEAIHDLNKTVVGCIVFE